MDRRRDRPDAARPNEKIYISNLSMDTSQDDLRKAFGAFGTITDVNRKQKDTGIVFAFIEYDSTQGAEKAVQDMNGKQFMNKELKVEFARGNRDRGDRGGFRGGDRGGYRGDREGGYRGGGDRGGEQRSRDCYNCGQVGHFARDCPNPRKQREDRGGYRGGNRDYRGGDRNDRNDRRDRDRDYRKKSEERDQSRSHDKNQKKKKRKDSDSY